MKRYKIKEDTTIKVGNYWCNDCDSILILENRLTGKFFTVAGHSTEKKDDFWGKIVFAICNYCLQKDSN